MATKAAPKKGGGTGKGSIGKRLGKGRSVERVNKQNANRAQEGIRNTRKSLRKSGVERGSAKWKKTMSNKRQDTKARLAHKDTKTKITARRQAQNARLTKKIGSGKISIRQAAKKREALMSRTKKRLGKSRDTMMSSVTKKTAKRITANQTKRKGIRKDLRKAGVERGTAAYKRKFTRRMKEDDKKK